MKLTPFGKLFIALVALGVIGFVGYKKYGDQLRSWSGASTPADTKTAGTGSGGTPTANTDVTKDDFAKMHDGMNDAPRNTAVAMADGQAVADIARHVDALRHLQHLRVLLRT